MQLNCGFDDQIIFNSFNLSVVHHCFMANSTLVASCRRVVNSKMFSRSLTANYDIK